MKLPKKILIIIQRSNGDVFLSTSLVKALYEYYDFPQIDLLVNDDTYAIARLIPFITNIYTFSYQEKQDNRWKQEKRLIQNIFKNDSDNTVNFTDKGREVLDNISLILDRIQQLSFLVTFYKSNNKIPKNMIIQADEDHQKCLNMYLEIIKKLKSIENTNKSCQQAIELYLFKHQFVVNHLNFSI